LKIVKQQAGGMFKKGDMNISKSVIGEKFLWKKRSVVIRKIGDPE
jgi:hypothetical protein